MMLASKKSVLPFGAVTLVLLGAALLAQVWPDSACKKLEGNMEAGYFLRWMPPQLMLITADKQNFMVNASDKQTACEAMLTEFKKP
jgi:hypothetical protein